MRVSFGSAGTVFAGLVAAFVVAGCNGDDSSSRPTATATPVATATDRPTSTAIRTPTRTPTRTSTRTGGPSTPTPPPPLGSTATCAPTGTPYCRDVCLPCATIRPGCFAQTCGTCRENPTSCPNGEVRHCGMNSGGCCVCATTTATSTPTPTGPTPTATATVTATSTGTPAVGVFAYVTDSTLAELHVIDTATRGEIFRIHLPELPLDVAVSANGRRAYVLGSSFRTVVVDTVFNVVVETIDQGAVGSAVAVHPLGSSFYIATFQAGELAVVDGVSGDIATRVTIGGTLGDVAISPDGTVAYVTNSQPPSVAVVDLENPRVLRTISLSAVPLALAVAPDGARIFVGLFPNLLSVIDVSTGTETAQITVGASPSALAITPAGDAVYVANRDAASVSIVDTTPPALERTILVGDQPRGLAFTPDGAFAYVGVAGRGSGTGSVPVISTQSRSVVDGIDYSGSSVAPGSVAIANIRP